MLRRKLSHVLAKIRNFLYVLLLIMFLFIFLSIYCMKRIQENEVLSKIPQSAIKYVEFQQHDNLKPLPINTIIDYIKEYNSKQRVLNLDSFGPLQPSAPVFVIFVDKYRVNLKYLLASLSSVAGIADALIIFSHSRFDENVNNLIQTIDFGRVLQIFYPYSLQIYPNEFPGYQDGDCPRHMDMDKAKALNCTGANTPDLHGLYRDPLQTQMKHYWWWTMNKVFENLPFIEDHTGIFTFLDDDVFLMEDFIYMTIQMKKLSQFLTVCEFISLMSPLFEFSYFDNMNTYSSYSVELTTWDPGDYSSVLSLDSSVWSSIAAHYYLFCSIDDASWARSLYYLSLNRIDGARFKVMSSKLPRAFKTSSSTYNHYVDYEVMQTINRILYVQELMNDNLYPPHLEIYINIELEDDDFVIFDFADSGGWSDPRDKNMCFNITTSKIKRVIMDMAHEFHQYEFIRSND